MFNEMKTILTISMPLIIALYLMPFCLVVRLSVFVALYLNCSWVLQLAFFPRLNCILLFSLYPNSGQLGYAFVYFVILVPIYTYAYELDRERGRK